MLKKTFNSIVSLYTFQIHQSIDQRKLLSILKVWSKSSQQALNKNTDYGVFISNFRDRKVKMYNHHQRGEYEQEEEVNKQISQLRKQQIKIAGKSKLAMKYVNQILNLGRSKDCTIEMRYERLRIYHKWLGFILR